jgi:acylphosphatase
VRRKLIFYMQQAHIFISGIVQGVGFRFFVKNNAKDREVTGWVRNAEDGGVEAVFCGEREKIEELIALCRKGPFLAEVKHLGFEWEKAETFPNFAVR